MSPEDVAAPGEQGWKGTGRSAGAALGTLMRCPNAAPTPPPHRDARTSCPCCRDLGLSCASPECPKNSAATRSPRSHRSQGPPRAAPRSCRLHGVISVLQKVLEKPFFSGPGTDECPKQMRLLRGGRVRSQKKTNGGSKQINKVKQELVCIPQPSADHRGYSGLTAQTASDTCTEPSPHAPNTPNPPQNLAQGCSHPNTMAGRAHSLL